MWAPVRRIVLAASAVMLVGCGCDSHVVPPRDDGGADSGRGDAGPPAPVRAPTRVYFDPDTRCEVRAPRVEAPPVPAGSPVPGQLLFHFLIGADPSLRDQLSGVVRSIRVDPVPMTLTRDWLMMAISERVMLGIEPNEGSRWSVRDRVGLESTPSVGRSAVPSGATLWRLDDRFSWVPPDSSWGTRGASGAAPSHLRTSVVPGSADETLPAVFWDRGEVVWLSGDNFVVGSCIESGTPRWAVEYDSPSIFTRLYGLENGDAFVQSGGHMFRLDRDGNVSAVREVESPADYHTILVPQTYHPNCGILEDEWPTGTRPMRWWSPETLEPVGEPFQLFAGRPIAVRSDCTLYAGGGGSGVFVMAPEGLRHRVPGAGFVAALEDDGALMFDLRSFHVIDAEGNVTAEFEAPADLGEPIGAGSLLGPNGVFYLATDDGFGAGQGVVAIYVGVRPGPDFVAQNWARTNTPLVRSE